MVSDERIDFPTIAFSGHCNAMPAPITATDGPVDGFIGALPFGRSHAASVAAAAAPVRTVRRLGVVMVYPVFATAVHSHDPAAMARNNEFCVCEP
ncbi:MAG TPA: hypothetical protein DEA50_07035 [Parvularcula sp.]|nr:hypothetical protein [Parvularcula sp.]